MTTETSNTPPAAGSIDETEAANLQLLGHVTWLLTSSPIHRHMFLSDLEWRIRPAIMLRQCRLFTRDGRPFAFVTWAYANDEIAGRLQAIPGRLRPEEWRCGKRVVLVDVVAPFGGAQECAAEAIKTAEAAVAAATKA